MPTTFVMRYAEPTLGMERVALRLIEELGKHEPVSLVVLSGGVPGHLEGVTTTLLRCEDARVPPALALAHVVRLARRSDQTVVLVGAWLAIPWLAVKSRHQRAVVWEHSMIREKVASSPNLRRLARCARYLYPRAYRVVAVSPPLAEDLRSSAPRSEIEVIPNLVDVPREVVVPPPAALDWRTHLLSLGSLTPTKNHELAVRALEHLPESFCLDVAGDGPQRESLAQVADRIGVGDRVTFHGYVTGPPLDDLWRRASCLVHASKGETFGMVFFEALARDIPVVTLENSLTVTVVPELVPGRLVADDPRDLARGVLDQTASPVSPRAFGVSRDRCAEEFGPDLVAGRWLRLLGARA